MILACHGAACPAASLANHPRGWYTISGFGAGAPSFFRQEYFAYHMIDRQDLRNIAIIAHVDHGKTTLVDAMFRQSGLFRENQKLNERVLDSNDIERERGITILSKNAAVTWKGVRINIVDTPGHADFGGEVERVLTMVSGALLLVDAAEGPMPQTRFVLTRALSLSLPLILVINKTDRPDARPEEALLNTQLLLMDLGAAEEQVNSPVIYAAGREGRAGRAPDALEPTLEPLFDAILAHIPCPRGNESAPVRMQVSTIDYSDYVGRIAIGRIDRGTLRVGDAIALCSPDRPAPGPATRVSGILMFEGLGRIPVPQASVGDIVALPGIDGIEIGKTLAHSEHPDPLPVIHVSEPTVAMAFMVNTGPLAGRDGRYVTSRQIGERLRRETRSDVALRVEDTQRADAFKVCGRGELHLSILIENMRREGYEFMVSKPDVITRAGPQGREEPIERLTLDIPESAVGAIMDSLSQRRAELVDMVVENGRGRLEYRVPSRGLFGFRGEMLTLTQGEGIMNAYFEGYGPVRGPMPGRKVGSLVASEAGKAIAAALFSAQNRGRLFIGPGEDVYQGMIVGSCSRAGDIVVNVCKGKKLTNMRAAGKDENVILSAPLRMTLEEALAYLEEDELLEVTPAAYRLRKRILNPQEAMRARRRAMTTAED